MRLTVTSAKVSIRATVLEFQYPGKDVIRVLRSLGYKWRERKIVFPYVYDAEQAIANLESAIQGRLEFVRHYDFEVFGTPSFLRYQSVRTPTPLPTTGTKNIRLWGARKHLRLLGKPLESVTIQSAVVPHIPFVCPTLTSVVGVDSQGNYFHTVRSYANLPAWAAEVEIVRQASRYWSEVTEVKQVSIEVSNAMTMQMIATDRGIGAKLPQTHLLHRRIRAWKAEVVLRLRQEPVHFEKELWAKALQTPARDWELPVVGEGTLPV